MSCIRKVLSTTALPDVATRTRCGGHSIQDGTKQLKRYRRVRLQTNRLLWAQQQSHTQTDKTCKSHKQKQTVNCDSNSTEPNDKSNVSTSKPKPKRVISLNQPPKMVQHTHSRNITPSLRLTVNPCRVTIPVHIP